MDIFISAAIFFIGLIIYKKYKKNKIRERNLKDNDYTIHSFI